MDVVIIITCIIIIIIIILIHDHVLDLEWMDGRNKKKILGFIFFFFFFCSSCQELSCLLMKKFCLFFKLKFNFFCLFPQTKNKQAKTEIQFRERENLAQEKNGQISMECHILSLAHLSFFFLSKFLKKRRKEKKSRTILIA